MKTLLAATAVAGAIFIIPATASAGTVIVNIDSQLTGCSTGCGGNHPQPGATIGEVFTTANASVTFDAGSYTIVNGKAETGATPGFDAWRYSGSEQTWIWAFIGVNATTNQVIVDSLTPPYDGVFAGDHTSVANSAYANNYVGHFTLAQQTTVNFLTEDYGVYDNAGGVALKITNDADAVGHPGGVPEPATWALMLGGFGLVGSAMRQRRRGMASAA